MAEKTESEEIMARTKDAFQAEYPTPVQIIQYSPGDWGYTESLALWQAFKKGFRYGMEYKIVEPGPKEEEEKPTFITKAKKEDKKQQ